MSKVPGREPRQNPVFMFLPSGGLSKQGPKNVFSVPGETAEDVANSARILKKNTVISVRPSPSPLRPRRGKSPKRPVLPLFRLPTPEEEAKMSKDQGASSFSSTPRKRVESGPGARSKLLSPPESENPTIILKHLCLKEKDSSSITKLVNIAHNCKNVSRLETLKTLTKLPQKKFENTVRWIRESASDTFWSEITKAYRSISADAKPWRWVSLLSTVTETAVMFMSNVEGLLKSFEDREDVTNLAAIDFLRKILSGNILSTRPEKCINEEGLDNMFQNFYSVGMRVVMKVRTELRPTSMQGGGDCDPDYMQTSGTRSRRRSSGECSVCQERKCVCELTLNIYEEANLALYALGLMDDLAGPRLFAVIKGTMLAKLEEVGTGNVTEMHYSEIIQWLQYSSPSWYHALYFRDTLVMGTKVPEVFQSNLIDMISRLYGMAIIKDLFSIIIEFPDSKPMLQDLKTCMAKVDMRTDLVSNLKSSLERRLLNAGVNTSAVLEAYIATVRALKFLDPSGILVQLVTPPVREYLKHREETVRVILISLTEETGELSEELVKNPTNPDKTSKLTFEYFATWKPDPIDVPKDKHNLRKSDLIEAMVSIYGSQTVFIDEYRALLADRLLRMPRPGPITHEIKCLELLKLRFGEADLQKCEVMLKDVTDSQRLNTRLYEEDGAVLANEDVHVTGLIVSAQFWPNFKQEDLLLPVPVQEALEKYTKSFEMIKGNRTLEWQKHIGTVRIEVEHRNTTLQFSVSPVQAAIIWHFQEKDVWNLDDLAKVLGTTTSYMNSRMGFWISKGIVTHLGGGNYSLSDTLHEPSGTAGKYIEEPESDSPMASTSSQRATELQVFWSYIEAMLTNLESLPLARIHSMLKLFATVECSSEELQKFLDEKVSQHQLVYSAGQYQLPK